MLALISPGTVLHTFSQPCSSEARQQGHGGLGYASPLPVPPVPVAFRKCFQHSSAALNLLMFQQISRGAITYSNTVEGSISSNSYSRNRNPLLNFACKIYDDAGAQTIPSVIRPAYQETPSRQFVVKFAFYDSPSFSNVVKEAPYYVMPSRDLFVRATLYSTQPNMMLFADTCVVSPNPHDFVTVASDIIRNG